MPKRKYTDREYRFITLAAARGVPYATAVELCRALEFHAPPPATYRNLARYVELGASIDEIVEKRPSYSNIVRGR